MQTNRITWETLQSLDSSTFTGVYVPFANPLKFPSYILKIVNNSNVLVTVSIDGATDIDVVPGNSFFLYDEGKVGISSYFPALPAGTKIWVKGAAGAGSVYLVSQYIIQG